MVNERKEMYVLTDYGIYEITFKNSDQIIDFMKDVFEIFNISKSSERINFISKIGYRVIKDDHIIKDIYTKIDHDCPISKLLIELNGIITVFENDK